MRSRRGCVESRCRWLRCDGALAPEPRSTLHEPTTNPPRRPRSSTFHPQPQRWNPLSTRGFRMSAGVGGGCWNRSMTATAQHPHRVTSAIADARASIGSVSETALWSMDPTETAATLLELKALAAQVAELQARALLRADQCEVAGDNASSSTANWHAVATTTSRATAHRQMRTAKSLETHDLTRAALAGGRLQVEQAEVILRGLSELPADLDTEILDQAEAR